MRKRSHAAVAGLLALIAGCGGAGKYVWVDEVPAEAPTPEYLLAEGDLVSVRVLNQDSLATRVRVRPDGRIALPILGDVEVRGKRPSALRAELEARYKDYLVAPSVTINVEESRPISVSVLGEVQKPGVVGLERTAGVAQALAAAGGLTDYASRDRIFVVRAARSALRVRFTYEMITRAEGRSASFLLRDGDVVVVE